MLKSISWIALVAKNRGSRAMTFRVLYLEAGWRHQVNLFK